jgi:hypothetical protein
VTYELSPLSRVGRLLSSTPSSGLGVVVPRLTDSSVVGLVAKVLGSVEPVAKERSLSDRVILSGDSGDLTGDDTETENGDGSGGRSGEVHC